VNFSLQHRVQTGCGAHPASYPMVPGALSLGVKRPGHDAHHSLPSSSEVENAWSYTSTPTTSSWCGARLEHSGSFTFTFTFNLPFIPGLASELHRWAFDRRCTLITDKECYSYSKLSERFISRCLRQDGSNLPLTTVDTNRKNSTKIKKKKKQWKYDCTLD